MRRLLREACTEGYLQTIEAERRGADRIELTEYIECGGITPSYGTLARLAEQVKIPINVIIRPRGGGFVYTADEIAIMESDIGICRKLGLAGVVFGVLQPSNELDADSMRRLAEAAGGMEVTCHMAFDSTPDQFKAIDRLAELGFNRILTKGGPKGPCTLNLQNMRALVEYAAGRITIMAGGGINAGNCEEIARVSGVTQVHGTRVLYSD